MIPYPLDCPYKSQEEASLVLFSAYFTYPSDAIPTAALPTQVKF